MRDEVDKVIAKLTKESQKLWKTLPKKYIQTVAKIVSLEIELESYSNQ